MADNTAIEWADRTWNPLLGCERVSPGCDACYAIRTATIRAGNPHPKVAAAFAGLTERRDGRLDWTGQINLLPDRLTEPIRLRKPQKIFVNSQSDLFHKDVPDEFIAQVFAVMALTPQHTYQLLTKRHARMRSLLSGGPDRAWIVPRHTSPFVRAIHEAARQIDPAAPLLRWPLPNLWLGVSVENQQWADIRIPALLDTPAAARWLSCEPLLGPLDLSRWLGPVEWPECWNDHSPSTECGRCIQPTWVVVGGESGPGARPMHPDWVRTLRDQCVRAEVPFFFKQWGEHLPYAPDDWSEEGGGCKAVNPDGSETWVAGDDDVLTNYGRNLADGWAFAHRVGKKAAGRRLDGRTWDEYPCQPEAVSA